MQKAVHEGNSLDRLPCKCRQMLMENIFTNRCRSHHQERTKPHFVREEEPAFPLQSKPACPTGKKKNQNQKQVRFGISKGNTRLILRTRARPTGRV